MGQRMLLHQAWVHLTLASAMVPVWLWQIVRVRFQGGRDPPETGHCSVLSKASEETTLRPDFVQCCPKHLRRRSCWEEEEKKRAKYAVVVRDCSGRRQSYTAFNLIDGDLSGQSLCKAYSLLGLGGGIGPAPTPAGSPGRVCLMF
ncbi:unnamed protein product [Boreogadus saida]